MLLHPPIFYLSSMLSKDNRLRDDKTITKTLRVGRRVNHDAVSLVINKSATPKTKIAVVVGTKVSKRAVVRNRLKRRTREALRLLITRLQPGFDIVVFPRPLVDDVTFLELQKILEELFLKARLLV